MVLMNLFAGQQWGHRQTERLVDAVWEGEGGWIERVASVQFSLFSSVAQLCPTLCDPKDCSNPGLPVHHQLLQFTQTHVH